MLEPLAEQRRRNLQHAGRLRSRELHDFAKHIGEAMGPVETLQHREAALHFHIINKERLFSVVRTHGLEARREVLRELLALQLAGNQVQSLSVALNGTAGKFFEGQGCSHQAHDLRRVCPTNCELSRDRSVVYPHSAHEPTWNQRLNLWKFETAIWLVL